MICGREQQTSHQETIDALQTSINNQQRVAEQQQKVMENLIIQQSFLLNRTEGFETQLNNLQISIETIQKQLRHINTDIIHLMQKLEQPQLARTLTQSSPILAEMRGEK